VPNRERGLLVAVVVVAVAVRLLLAVHLDADPPGGMTLEGEARNLLEGRGYSLTIRELDGSAHDVPSVYDVPGYAILLATTWLVTGSDSTVWIRLLQIAIDALLCLLVFRIGRDTVGARAALAGALLYALYLPQATAAASVGRDAWGTFGVVVVTFLFLTFAQDGRWRYAVATGVVVGLVGYVRPMVLLLPVALAIAAVRHLGLRRAILAAGVMVIVAHASLLPWAARNYTAYGRWIFTRANLYQSFWVGFGSFSNPVGALNSEEKTLAHMQAEGFPGRSNSTLEYEEFVKPRAIAVIRDHPLWYASVVLRRIPRALLVHRLSWGVLQDHRLGYHTAFVGQGHERSIMTYVSWLARRNPGFLVTKALDALVLAAAAAGAWHVRKAGWRLAVLLAVPAYVVMVHAVINVEGRYILPAHWVYLLLVGALVADLVPRRVPAPEAWHGAH